MEFACPTCQGRWESTEPNGGNCPYCSAIVAEQTPPALPEDAIQEGPPPLDYWDEYLKPLEGEGWLSAACALVALSGFLDLWQAFTEIDKANAVAGVLHGAEMAEQWARAQRTGSLLSAASLILFVITTIITWCWFRAAHRNLATLEVTGMSYGPNELLKGSLFPWRLTFLPYRAVQELWLASHPALKRDPDLWKHRPRSRLILVWWTLFLLGWIRISITIQPFPHDPFTLNILLVAAGVSTAACILHAASALLFIVIILRIEQRQKDRYDRLTVA